MYKALPQRFNPDLLARDGTRFQLVLPQDRMKRLAAVVLGSDQRCLEPMSVIVDEPYELVFVENQEQAEALPKQLDPVITDEHGQIHVVDLFEDEVILHVPTIPKHEDSSECRVAKTEFGDIPADVEEGKPNPFEALKNLHLH